VIRKTWLTPTVVELRFEPSRKFSFEPGQFVSVLIPSPTGAGKPLRRAYSLALASHEGYALCVKMVPRGPGSSYIASLREGDTFKAFAPYGDFFYVPETGRAACFISTGTGVAPLFSMVRSKAFRESEAPQSISIFGARTEDELILPGLFTSLGLIEVNAVSRASSEYQGFHGRVTDYLKALSSDWPWFETDFYLCGNGAMVSEVRKHLRGRGVPDGHIHQEVYFSAPDRREEEMARIAVPPPMKKAG
jgi:ferredoxin-NADP reductase